MSKITVLLADAEFARFDAYCDERGFKKSTLISRLIREHLDAEQYGTQAQLNFDDTTSRALQKISQ